MAFGRRQKKRSWIINGQSLEQVCFKYLVMALQSTGDRNAHIQYAATQGEKTANTILRFYHSKGGHYIPAAQKLFQAKVVIQMLYGTFMGPPPSSFDPIERVQSKFLRAILEVPRCVTNAQIRLEAD